MSTASASNIAISPSADFAATSPVYWQTARRPLPSLVFLIPLLVVYEVGVLVMGGGRPETIRNGADFWMRDALTQLGVGSAIVLPALIIGGLLVWHSCQKHPWKISMDTLVGMCAESLIFAFLLRLLCQVQDMAFHKLKISGHFAANITVSDSQSAQLITFIGAGIYEEVMFRLCLLPVVFFVFRRVGFSNGWACALSVVSTSLLFSWAHYIGASADQLTLFSFTFRALAGIYFASLFFVRGFGITVGTHAAYDLLVGILLVVHE